MPCVIPTNRGRNMCGKPVYKNNLCKYCFEYLVMAPIPEDPTLKRTFGHCSKCNGCKTVIRGTFEYGFCKKCIPSESEQQDVTLEVLIKAICRNKKFVFDCSNEVFNYLKEQVTDQFDHIVFEPGKNRIPHNFKMRVELKTTARHTSENFNENLPTHLGWFTIEDGKDQTNKIGKIYFGNDFKIITSN